MGNDEGRGGSAGRSGKLLRLWENPGKGSDLVLRGNGSVSTTNMARDADSQSGS